MSFLNYNKNEKLEFNYKKACGLWLIVVALIILLATLIGGGKTNHQYASILHWLCYQFFLNKYE